MNGTETDAGPSGTTANALTQISGGWLRAPVEIDLGCHKGTFVVEMARRYPEMRFLGVEQQRSRVEKSRAKIERLRLTNAWAVQGEGLEALRDQLPAGAARVIHISFPDPWPKRRHHARRLVNRDLLRAAWRALEAGGTLRLMTDDEAYFLAMRDAVEGFAGFREVPWADGREYPETEFQKKFAALGKPFYRLALGRCDATASA